MPPQLRERHYLQFSLRNVRDTRGYDTRHAELRPDDTDSQEDEVQSDEDSESCIGSIETDRNGAPTVHAASSGCDVQLT